MSADETESSGLIQQRKTAERGMGQALVMFLVAFSGLLIATIPLGRLDDGWLPWVQLLVGVGLSILVIVLAVFELRARRRRIADFEEAHGRDAGRQNPA